MTLTAVLFWILFAVTGVCAVAMVITPNIVRAATWLLFTLGGVAGVFFLLNADFVGATQLLVYVGGTLVLVVFGVMLTAQGPFISMRTGAAEWVIGVGAGLLLYGVLAVTIISKDVLPPSRESEQGNHPMADATPLGGSLLGVKEAMANEPVTGMTSDVLHVPPNVRRPRAKMSYLLPFEIVSVHLLVVLIGAAYLARAKRRRGALS
jgi:NADH-quinone oxidoreductase subunit J